MTLIEFVGAYNTTGNVIVMCAKSRRKVFIFSCFAYTRSGFYSTEADAFKTLVFFESIRVDVMGGIEVPFFFKLYFSRY